MREAGMDDVISKPFKVDDLVKKVRSLVLDGGGGSKHDNRPNGSSNTEKDDKSDDQKDKGGGLHPRDAERLEDKTHSDEERGNRERGGERSRSRATIRTGEATHQNESATHPNHS